MTQHEQIRQLAHYNRLFKQCDDLYRQIARQFDMPETELWILYTLQTAGPCTQAELCGLLYQPKQSINSMLKKLEATEIVRLAQTDGNRKSKTIHLTDRGLALARRTADAIILAETTALDRMGLPDREGFLTLFDRFVSLLQEEMAHIAPQEDLFS